jgi:hypothetical protein
LALYSLSEKDQTIFVLFLLSGHHYRRDLKSHEMRMIVHEKKNFGMVHENYCT